MTESFSSENYSVHDLVKKSEEFYVKAGLRPMKPSFWEKSMFVKPEDGRLVDCHAASYDFALNCDYRYIFRFNIIPTFCKLKKNLEQYFIL